MECPMKCIFVLMTAVFFLKATCLAAETKNWWAAFGATEIAYPLSSDKSNGKALFRATASEQERPLFVALHSWSADHTRPYPEWLHYCVDKDWAFIEPNFRGPNNNPDAMCSDIALQDILDAVKYACQKTRVDIKRIYLSGFSGGGMAALVLAGRYPHIWAGVSVWCPLTDVRKWYEYRRALGGKEDQYANELMQVVGGDPLKDVKAAMECARRSPVTWLHNAGDLPISICVGIQDNIIPNSHSFRAFNLLADPQDSFSEREIVEIRDSRTIPKLMLNHVAKSKYGEIYFRRTSKNIAITAVKGGHTFRIGDLDWLAEKHQ